MKDISAMEMFIAFRKGIQDLIKDNPKATAKEVLDGLEMTVEIMEVIVKRVKGGDKDG